MKSSLFQTLNDAAKEPWKAFAVGSGFLAVFLAIAWLISGDYLDEVWLHQLWLVPFMGLFFAGFSARLNAAPWRRWLSRCLLTAFVIVGIYAINAVGPLLAETDYPVRIFAILAGAVMLLYHAVLGIAALVVSAASCLFMKRHRLTS